MVCPPTFIATRQRCGGACREELGDLWVAFFLRCFWLILLRRENVIQRASSTQSVERSSYRSTLRKTRRTAASFIVAYACLSPTQRCNQFPLLDTRFPSMLSNSIHNDGLR